MKSESIFYKQWSGDIINSIKLKYENISEKKLNALLSKIFNERVNDRPVVVQNNYSHNRFNTTILDLIDDINKNNLIMAGGGCLFLPHGIKRNLLAEFIVMNQDNRSLAKKERKKYKKGTMEWTNWDITQANIKLVINSLYGCLGYYRFFLFNIYLAECITNQGRRIITTCIAGFENYMGDGYIFSCEGEVISYINNIHNEYIENNYEDIININQFNSVDNIHDKTINRLREHCAFEVSNSFNNLISSIVNNMDTKECLVLYYKNNLEEFNNNKFMIDNFKYTLDYNGLLEFGAMYKLKDDVSRKLVNTIMSIYNIFVVYNYPIYDRMRKAMYQIKTKSLYTDTDSAFISLASLVSYIRDVVYNGKPMDGLTIKQTEYSGAFLMFIFIDIVADMALKTLCKISNIPDIWAERLIIKNEYFYSRIVFMDKKKRYIANALFQEGQMLGDGLGLPDIKGLDFKKSTTNAFVRDYYTDLTIQYILQPDTISPQLIFRKILELKSNIEISIHEGERKFYRQASVKTPNQYKRPYSTSQYVSTLLWNILNPDNMIELPADIYTVPIKEITYKKPTDVQISKGLIKSPLDYRNIAEFADKHPKEYQLIYDNIYCNTNRDIRHMTMKNIAIPRNDNVVVSEAIYDLINFSNITTNAMTLYMPVMNSIGVKGLPVESNVTHMSNIIDL